MAAIAEGGGCRGEKGWCTTNPKRKRKDVVSLLLCGGSLFQISTPTPNHAHKHKSTNSVAQIHFLSQ